MMDNSTEAAQKLYISYLRARDPSIQSSSVDLRKVCVNLQEHLTEETHEDDSEPHIQIYLRIKNENQNNLYTIEDDTKLICKVPANSNYARKQNTGKLTKMYTFSKIFDCDSSQLDVFDWGLKKKVLNFINGKNSNILTYGVSGSGKTFTMIGTPDHPGIIPRSLEYLYRTLPELAKLPVIKPHYNGTIIKLSEHFQKVEVNNYQQLLNASDLDFQQCETVYRNMQEHLKRCSVGTLEVPPNFSLSIWISYAEIYNECVYDLLKSNQQFNQRQKLQINGNGSSHIYIENLTYLHAASSLEAFCILQYGYSNLKYAATKINNHSSRSHSIFTIKLAQSSADSEHVSCFSFCDLAGSERVKNTSHEGQRLKESKNINTSLMTLGRCMNIIQQNQKNSSNSVVPFRDSKLTQVFQRALLGYENMTVIATINPLDDMFDETQHVLKFTAIAQKIILYESPVKTSNTTSAEFEEQINQLLSSLEIQEERCQELEEELDELKKERQEEIEEIEARTQARIVEKYSKLLNDNTAFWKKRYEDKKLELTKELEEAKSNRKRVVDLDSSSEEDYLRTQLSIWKNRANMLQQKVTELESKSVVQTENQIQMEQQTKN